MNSQQRRELMFASLAGLSVGDAFGQQFNWHPEDIAIQRTDVPIWKWTDDTEMAISIVRVISEIGEIDQDYLADLFLQEFDPARGYGPAMLYDYFHQMKSGTNWRKAASSLFDGSGSYGNGSAMRVAPLGACFSDDLAKVVEQATLSAEVTHTHPEGIAGAVAIAVAAAVAAQQRTTKTVTGSRTFIEAILPWVPESRTRRFITQAYEELGPNVDSEKVAQLVGNGSGVTCQDTVPFCVFVAGQHLNNYETAMWETVRVLGDMDTTCAIVGGIIAANVGREGIPDEWVHSTESVPIFDANG